MWFGNLKFSDEYFFMLMYENKSQSLAESKEEWECILEKEKYWVYHSHLSKSGKLRRAEQKRLENTVSLFVASKACLRKMTLNLISLYRNTSEMELIKDAVPLKLLY